ncbi:hypothetical protein N7495_009136 [Penicillium taxi]|uniref:uncharacterized protein n=1 Tax=Penicillium taxi TaxID=168475 RepID=UPI00254574E4|nr:uncharacterized protein N7495_009136 [Penicillium taxi]KAJ5889095.1 hypothetical protein N7495_009136 [Penicillium taxi]
MSARMKSQPEARTREWCGAWSKEAGAWRREVAERRPFSASPAAEKGNQTAKRNSLRGLMIN